MEFILLTSTRREYLYKLEDLSGQHHTGEYIAGIINNLIQRIGKGKIAAIVSDNRSNVQKARELVTTQHHFN